MDGADYREMPVNGGVDDLITLWKTRKKASRCPPRAGRQARAQLREPGSRRPGRPQVAGRPGGIVEGLLWHWALDSRKAFA